MASCPPEPLEDLADVLADVRTWVGVTETRPGVFYLHRQSFLHFHLLAGARRRADVGAIRPPMGRRYETGPVRRLQRKVEVTHAAQVLGLLSERFDVRTPDDLDGAWLT